MRHRVGSRLDLVDEAAGLEVLDNPFACGKTIEPMQGQRLVERRRWRYAMQERGVVSEIKFCPRIEHIDERQAVPVSNLEIVEIMRRGDLHCARTFFRIGVGIADDWDAAADKRQHHDLADQMFEPFVLRMHRDRDVAQHGFRARRRHDDEGRRLVRIERPALDRIAQIPKLAPGLDLLDFQVRNRGLEFRVPVDEALVLVDQAGAVELDENFRDRARQPLVHGEALTRPVARGAEAL